MIHGKFRCQWCGMYVLLVIDESAGRTQQWVDDCEFCCRPNLLSLTYDPETQETEIIARRENE